MPSSPARSRRRGRFAASRARKARPLTLTGRLVDGEEALRLGLVHELVPKDRVMDRSLELARELGAKPPVAMKLTKQALRDFTQGVFDGAIDKGKELQPQAYASGEPQRVIAEFLARKK